MRNIQKISFFFLLYLFFLISVCNATSKHSSIHDKKKDKTNNKYKKRNSREKFSKRKLSDPEEEEFPFRPLKIYLDMEEFEHTFPDELEDYKNNYLMAMNKSKSILEDFLEIQTDTITAGGKIIVDSKVDYVLNNYGITKCTDVFRNTYLSVTDYNYYILAKFTSELGEESASVILDDFARAPLVGIVLFNNNTEKLDKTKLTLEYLTTLMLHHFIRLLGFNAALSESAYDYLPSETIDGNKIYYLKTEGEYNFTNVINYARKYFNCPSIERIDLYVDDENLDDEGWNYEYTINNIIGLYWPKRLFLGELLTKFDYPEEQVLSGFTLAFLDDLPYLRVTKNYNGGSLKFGKNKGCEFFYNYCGNSSNSRSTFANEFFLPNDPGIGQKPSCSSGRLSKTIYKLESIAEEDKDNEALIFEYYLGNFEFGGSRATNFCPIAQFDYSSTERYIYSGRCSDSKTTLTDGRNEKISDNSFCVLSSLESGTSSTPEPEVLSLCYEMKCSPKSLTIKIGEYYIVCPREGGKIKAKGFNGYLLCPDYYLICNSHPLCNNLINCLESNSTEKEESFYYEYNENKEIRTTQDSTVYKTESRNYGWELTDDGDCPKLCMQCKSHSDCTRCAPHFDFKNGECVDAIEHCKSFTDEENDICTKCDDAYFLVENSNGDRYCENVGIEQYYLYIDEGDLKVHKKCEIENCNTCAYADEFESKVKCTSCASPYEEIDGGSFCGDPSTKFYYEDSSGVFKSCTKHEPANTCSKCEKTGDTFTCLECTSNYVLYHGNNPPTCLDKNDIDDTMFTNDNKNYYPCNNREYHDIDGCVECNKKDECNLCSSEYTLANGTKTCLLTSLIDDKKYYKNPNNNYYYKCPDSCSTCESATKCLTCATSYLLDESDICFESSLFETDKFYYYNDALDKYSKCSNIQNCQKCLSSTECIGCINNYYLVKGRDDLLSCQNIDISKYYPTIEGTKTYYKKCEDAIQNCEECSASNKCTKCKTNFGIVDNDHTQCVDISNEKYYYDTTLETFKLCGNKMTNCEYCSTYGDFTCKKCFSSYSFKHDNSITCEEKTTLEGNNYFYTNDSKINYYSCRLFHDALNCEKCASKEICEECQRGYDLYNNKRLCAKQGDIDNNIFTWTNDDILVLCSSAIKDCERCNDTATCYSCQDEAGLIDNDTCVNKTILEQNKNHYYDEKSKRYISCSVMDNCITCDSSTVCTSCQAGFVLSGNLCSNADDGDDGLSTGAIIGIVFGCIGFLLLVAGIAFFLITKIFKKNINNVIQMDADNKVEIQEEKGVEKEKVNEVVLHKAKRSIHNV